MHFLFCFNALAPVHPQQECCHTAHGQSGVSPSENKAGGSIYLLYFYFTGSIRAAYQYRRECLRPRKAHDR